MNRPRPTVTAAAAAAISSTALPSQQTSESVVNEALDWVCGSTATYRSVTNVSGYDASACDVLDANIIVDCMLADQ